MTVWFSPALSLHKLMSHRSGCHPSDMRTRHLSTANTHVFLLERQRWKQRYRLLLEQLLQWEQTDPVRKHTLRCFLVFSWAAYRLAGCCAAGHYRNPWTTLLAVLPPSSYCFTKTPSLPSLAASQLQNPKRCFIPFLYGLLKTTWAKHIRRCCGLGSLCTAAVAFWDVHALGKIQIAPSGLCWEKHHVTLRVTVPGAALCRCLALLLGECCWAPSQKTMQMEKLAGWPDRIASPYVFFRESTVSLSPYIICKQNRAAHCCLTPAAEALAEHGRFSKDTFICTYPKRAFQSTQSIHLCATVLLKFALSR